MYGFKKGAGKAERKSFANGGTVDDGATPFAAARGFGMVRGPGTGTSDDVKDAVPPGTYIMPADSTQEIGPEALGAAGFRPGSKPKAPNIPGMGFGASAQVPVNLSNGEFRLSPEQVHAIGVQVLEGMKAATHTPVGEQGDNDGDDASTRELFFADGGLVERTAKYWSEDNKRFEQTNPGIASRIGRAINPLTSFGSAMGAMRDAAGAGDGVGMALAGASSIPAFGVMRAAGPAIKSIIPAPAVLAPSIKGTAASVATNGLVGAAADAYEPEPRGYADGGLVEDPNKKRPLATSPTNTYPGNQAERAGNIYAQANADLARGFGAATSYLNRGDPVKDAASAVGGFFADSAAKARQPNAWDDSGTKPQFATPDVAPKPAAPPAAAAPAQAAPTSATPAVAAASPAAKPGGGMDPTPPNSGPVPYTVTPVENTNGVQRINQPGKSPLFTNIDPGQAVAEMKGNPVGGFQPASVRGDAAGAAPSGPGLGFGPGSAAGSPDVLGILQRESDIRAGMGSIQDRINFNSGNGVGFRQTEQGERGFTTIRDGAQAERDRAAVMDAALKPLAGARNGQLTANQLRTAQGMVEADQRNEQSRYQTDANAATQLETTGMREAGENQRTGVREAGANNRANASNQIQQGELGLRKEAQGFQSRAAQRQEDLQAKYEAAKTPEERSAIAQQIRDLSGKQEPQNRFTVVPGGQAFNPDGTPYTLPARVLNNQTGAFVDQPQAAEQAAIKAGEVRKGYRFKGGNPADQASWEKV